MGWDYGCALHKGTLPLIKLGAKAPFAEDTETDAIMFTSRDLKKFERRSDEFEGGGRDVLQTEKHPSFRDPIKVSVVAEPMIRLR